MTLICTRHLKFWHTSLHVTNNTIVFKVIHVTHYITQVLQNTTINRSNITNTITLPLLKKSLSVMKTFNLKHLTIKHKL